MTEHLDRRTHSTTRRPQPRGLRTRAKILAAAATRFDTEGYSLASINDILAGAETTKGAMYFHFASKEAMAQQLASDWSTAVHKAFSAAAGEPLIQQMTTVFRSLARQLESDTNLRAGLKLTLEPSIDGAHQSYMQWVDETSELVDRANEAGDISDTDAAHRLAWNLCAGFTGAVQASAVLREDVNLSTRVEDVLDAHISAIAAPARNHHRIRDLGDAIRNTKLATELIITAGDPCL
ncbi:TetR/AcrR family transcriptional regulator [Rhodococcus sp. IEGM 1379]|uniref:TetR/AcrR family transcriptional regulator n=1 Tax=Rhodococcus sp. IEGM 1379 TaxID=3047086 RepID=UPI0024B80723|nr:TetR/AcrR family transcriptional regulator [Rhodococcus sp. IEGM 1379]MDI9918642.1 TetR family transcriptional regulator [Rhodococcus sp. IEGM 1379]